MSFQPLDVGKNPSKSVLPQQAYREYFSGSKASLEKFNIATAMNCYINTSLTWQEKMKKYVNF
jgi:hypothetical protein